MPRLTLEGFIPIYILIDTDEMTVNQVCASDEEFRYASERTDLDGNISFKSIAGEPVLAYTEEGKPLDYDENRELIERALGIAESDPDVVGDKLVDWPAWSWG